MDKFVAAYAAEPDGDLTLCPQSGVAYQTDMAAARVPYDADYMAKCDAYAGSDIAKAVNAGRCALLQRYIAEDGSVLDIGAGSGDFVRSAASWGFSAKGFDVIPETADRLRADGLYADPSKTFDAVTMWDVLEHIEDPAPVLGILRAGALLFVSIPVFADLATVRQSKHYRPGEHLYYWTAPGFVAWMALHGFALLEQSDHETAAGRDSIAAFAFKKVLRTCACGSVPVVDYFDWPKKDRFWFVTCTSCGTTGPDAPTETTAQDGWNRGLPPCNRAS